MYRIFCESYLNYINSFDNDNYRLKIAEPLKLICNLNEYELEKEQDSIIYKKLSDLMYFMEQNINKYPKLKAFLWTLDSRKIKAKKYGITKENDLEEQIKIVNSLLKLAYWY